MLLSRFAPRQFLPETIDLNDTAQLEPVFAKLERQLDAVASVSELEVWLRNHSEVSAALDQSSALIYIAMSCQTDDEEKQKAYLHIVEVVEPWLKPRQFALMRELVSSPFFALLPPFYAVFRRSVAMQVKVYREENVARETEMAKLKQEYQKIRAAMTVLFEGEEQTLVRLARIQEDPDRPRRKAVWKAVAERRLQDRDRLEDLFDQMLALRHEIALAAGFSDFRAYTFAARERFDYTPEDCLRFHEAIERQVVPLARELAEERRQKLGLDRLRPWDLAVDPDQNPPLQPFVDSMELLEKSQRLFSRLDPRLGAYFDVLRTRKLCDLDNRKGKRPGGYQYTLSEARVPYIFMNAVGTALDVRILIHEAGHAFHALASRELPLLSYRTPTEEICEVASMGMELLAAPHLDVFYSEKEARRTWREQLESIINRFPWIATVDAFQHWIYTHPGHTRAQRAACWLSLLDRFGGIEDWSGLEEARAYAWHLQLHIFEHPFYYVEYGIAQLGALQLWQASQRDLSGTLDHYLQGLSLGGSRPLPELFQATGLAFDFTEGTFAPLMKNLKEALAELAG